MVLTQQVVSLLGAGQLAFSLYILTQHILQNQKTRKYNIISVTRRISSRINDTAVMNVPRLIEF